MTNPVTLTFAEVEFLLRARPEQAATVRERLRINPDAASEIVVAAGLASLLARGLCEVSGDDVLPKGLIVALATGLSTSNAYCEAVAWVGTRMTLVHFLDSASIRLAIFPVGSGQYTIELLDAQEPVTGPLTRFLDTMAQGEGDLALAIRSIAPSGEVSLAVARDAQGNWHLSDSQDSPDRGQPSTRDGVAQRISQLLGPQAVGANGR